MQNIVNRRWFLKQYPEGMPTLDNWTMDEQRVPDPGPGQILVKAKWLSVDPYMRGRMSPATNYTKGVEIGELMQGGGVGEVVASNHPKWKAGDIAESMSFGWQEWSVLTPDVSGPAGVNRIDPNLAPIESSLSWLGMPGITAYFGLLELGRPRPGDTVVVSAVDVFFDNTAGAIHDAVMKNLRTGARVVICGHVALAGQFGKPDIGERFMGQLIVTRASIHGFLAFDWWHRREEALQRLSEWQRAGKIRFKGDVLDGIERMPEAFLRLLSGKNFGKQIIRIV
jgi:NADPH-dependent curcumin reductase CurA